MVSLTICSRDAIARGVKTRFTSLRIRSCSGGSKLMMILPIGAYRVADALTMSSVTPLADE